MSYCNLFLCLRGSAANAYSFRMRKFLFHHGESSVPPCGMEFTPWRNNLALGSKDTAYFAGISNIKANKKEK